MNDLSQTLEVGTLLIIETGEYSETEFNDPVRVIKAFTKQEVALAYSKQWKPKYEWQKLVSERDFLPWLIKNRYVEHVDNVERWHIDTCEDDFRLKP